MHEGNDMNRKAFFRWVLLLAPLGYLFAIGGWQRLVAMVAIGVAVIVGGIAWIAEKLSSEWSQKQ
jgi:hypothetical protein